MNAQKMLELLYHMEADGEVLSEVQLIFEIRQPDTGTKVRLLPGVVGRDDDGHLVFR